MPIKNFALAALLLVVGASLAQADTHRVRSGDNDASIAKRYGIKVSTLRRLNPDADWRHLKIGTRLDLPGDDPKPSRRSRGSKRSSGAASSEGGSGSRVGERDNDYTIARRAGISVAALHRLNPDVNWRRLKPGTRIVVSAAPVARKSSAPSDGNLGRYAKVAKANVAVRANGSSSSRVLARVDAGAAGWVVGVRADWVRMQFASGTTGWVRHDLLKGIPAPKASAKPVRVAQAKPAGKSAIVKATKPTRVAARSGLDALLEKAYSYRGVRYSYGAASRSGTDCSGFTTQVFRSQGVTLPRTSAGQAQVGKYVSKGGLKPGDLVFFRTRRGMRISHVGIYIGGGRFIHASSGQGRVTTNALTDGYYAHTYATARRVIEFKPTRIAQAPKKEESKPAVETIPATDAPVETPPASAKEGGETGGG